MRKFILFLIASLIIVSACENDSNIRSDMRDEAIKVFQIIEQRTSESKRISDIEYAKINSFLNKYAKEKLNDDEKKLGGLIGELAQINLMIKLSDLLDESEDSLKLAESYVRKSEQVKLLLNIQ